MLAGKSGELQHAARRRQTLQHRCSTGESPETRGPSRWALSPLLTHNFNSLPFSFARVFSRGGVIFFLPLARVCASRVFQAMTSCFFSVPSARIFAACTSRCKFYRHAVFAFRGAGVLQRRDPGGGRAWRYAQNNADPRRANLFVFSGARGSPRPKADGCQAKYMRVSCAFFSQAFLSYCPVASWSLNLFSLLR